MFFWNVYGLSTILGGELPLAPTEILSQCPDRAELRGENTEIQSQQPHWLTDPPTFPRYGKTGEMDSF